MINQNKRHDFENYVVNKNIPLDRLVKYISKSVKQEKNLIKLLIFGMTSAYTPDPINIGIEGPPGEGKTHPVVEVAKLFPKNDVMMLGGLSPTALVHDHSKLIDESGKPLKPQLDKKYQELENADKKQEKKIKREIAFILNNAIRLVDLKGKIIIFLESPHRDTWGKLRPILSHDVWETTFKFTDKLYRGGPMSTVTVIMRGWPAVIYTSADSKSDGIWNQIKSRFLIVSPKMGLDKYKESIKLLGERKGVPKPRSIYNNEKKELNWCKDYILNIRNGLEKKLKPFYEFYDAKDVTITWIPYQKQIVNDFPKNKGQRMRDFANFIRVLQVSAIFNSFDRPILVIEKDKFIIATIEDLELTKNLLNRATVLSRQGQHIIDFHKKIILKLWNYKQDDEGFITVKDMVDRCKDGGNPLSSDTIRKNYLKPLNDEGVITLEKDIRDNRRYVIKVLRTEISDDAGFFENPIKFSSDNFNNAIETLINTRVNLNFILQIFSRKLKLMIR